MYDRYMETLREIDGDALLLHKLQLVDDGQLSNLTNRNEDFNSPREVDTNAYTLVMVINPTHIYE